MAEDQGYSSTMMMYFRIAALVGLVALGFWIKQIWSQNQELKEQAAVMTLQIEKNAQNVKLLVQQLDREIEYRQIAETALGQLSEVPDVVYSQGLPPEIQGVVDRFHARIGR
jgi:hypothetical protein